MAAKKETELAKATQQQTGLAAADSPPAYLVSQSGRGAGTEVAAANAIQMIGKVVQANSGKELKDEHGEGSLIISPDGLLLHQYEGDPVTVIVIHQHESFECWNDFNDTSSPTVQFRSVNPASSLAARCRASEDGDREEGYADGKFTRTYDVYHNFVCLVDSGEHKGKMFRMAFGGKWNRSARKWSSIIDERGKIGVPIFGARYDLTTEFIEQKPYSWYAARAGNPSKDRGGAWVGEDQLQVVSRMYAAAEAAYRREIEADAAAEEAERRRAADQIPV